MDRRLLIAAGAAAGFAATARRAVASEKAPPAAVLNFGSIGLPVIAGGRVRNYVFVSLRLHLGPGKTPEQMRPKTPFLKDALVRAAHAAPFTIADDWSRLDAAALSASLMRSAATIAGRGSVTRVEVVSQAPRRAGLRPR